MAESMTVNSPAPRGEQHLTESYAPFSDTSPEVPSTSGQKQAAYLQALHVEKQGYLARGAQDRAKDVDAEIARVKAQSAAEFDSVPVPADPGNPISIRTRL